MFGLDSDILKFLALTGQNYLVWRDDPQSQDQTLVETVGSMLTQPTILPRVHDAPLLAKLKPNLDPEKLDDLNLQLWQIATQNPQGYLELTFGLHEMARAMAHDSNIRIPDADLNLAKFPHGNSGDEVATAYTAATIQARNRVMVENFQQAICASSSDLPAILSIGSKHMPGVVGLLKAWFPAANVQAIDIDAQ